MKDVVKAFDKLPWIVKILLCLPLLNIAWGVYRICKGIDEKNREFAKSMRVISALEVTT